MRAKSSANDYEVIVRSAWKASIFVLSTFTMVLVNIPKIPTWFRCWFHFWEDIPFPLLSYLNKALEANQHLSDKRLDNCYRGIPTNTPYVYSNWFFWHSKTHRIYVPCMIYIYIYICTYICLFDPFMINVGVLYIHQSHGCYGKTFQTSHFFWWNATFLLLFSTEDGVESLQRRLSSMWSWRQVPCLQFGGESESLRIRRGPRAFCWSRIGWMGSNPITKKNRNILLGGGFTYFCIFTP